jgi:hypothetical protein
MAIAEAIKPRRIKRFENTIVKTFLWEAVTDGTKSPPEYWNLTVWNFEQPNGDVRSRRTRIAASLLRLRYYYVPVNRSDSFGTLLKKATLIWLRAIQVGARPAKFHK